MLAGFALGVYIRAIFTTIVILTVQVPRVLVEFIFSHEDHNEKWAK